MLLPLRGSCGHTGLIIAHPDDESMFFAPAIASLVKRGADVFILCLSSGNFYGLGHVRKHEMVKACGFLGVPEEQVEIVEHPELQDGSTVPWPAEMIASLVAAFVEKRQLRKLLTFDELGVSGHPDHRAVHRGVLQYAAQHCSGSPPQQQLLPSPPPPPSLPCGRTGGAHPGPAVLLLETTNILRKYSGALDWLWSRATSPGPSIALNLDPRQAWHAMAAHRSQFVWYRRLFVVFSRYAYVNTFREAVATATAASSVPRQ